MRKISKDYVNPPAPLTGPAANTRLLTIARARAYTGTTYKHADVITALNRLYHSKCGYCEASIKTVSHQHVEHYRPKGGVNAQDLTGPGHRGYYWLGNEWSNLLIACTLCNENGKKGTRFPLVNNTTRVSRHPRLTNSTTYNQPANHINHIHLRPEVPLIINPETRDPKKHLKVERTGKLTPQRGSVYGAKTIEILDLNRGGLIEPRKLIIDEVIGQVNHALKAHTRNQAPLTEEQFQLQLFDLFDDITKKTGAKYQYTLVYRKILKNFDTIVVNHKHIEPQFRPKVQAAYDAYST